MRRSFNFLGDLVNEFLIFSDRNVLYFEESEHQFHRLKNSPDEKHLCYRKRNIKYISILLSYYAFDDR